MRRSRLLLGLIVLAVGLLVGWYVVFTQRVIAELRRETEVSGRMYARIYAAQGDTAETAGEIALFDLSRHILEMGVPVVVTDDDGNPSAAANLPFTFDSITDPRVRDYVRRLDQENPPVAEHGGVTVHFGATPLVSRMRTIPVLQGIVLVTIVLLGVYLVATRERMEREHVWAGMAREAAHQLGTPLSSLSGWIEVLRERAGEPVFANALEHMEGDLVRLERVAHRFERIGRPPRKDETDVAALVSRVAEYFRARVPSLVHPIRIVCTTETPGPHVVHGDAVLLEWVLESLTKNAIDALGGRGGTITLAIAGLPEGRVRVRVSDDGPGVPKELRKRVFDPGFTTKKHGWGIGLSLARRIVEENHKGRITLAPAAAGGGATFDVILN